MLIIKRSRGFDFGMLEFLIHIGLDELIQYYFKPYNNM
jgi:hypothetical protein